MARKAVILWPARRCIPPILISRHGVSSGFPTVELYLLGLPVKDLNFTYYPKSIFNSSFIQFQSVSEATKKRPPTSGNLARNFPMPQNPNIDLQHPNKDRQTLLPPKIPVTKNGFFRTWFATSADLRATHGSDAVIWGIHWYTPVSIALLLLLGIASTVAQHLFYSSLHDTDVAKGSESDQQWVSLTGSSLGFLTKVCFTAVLAISRTQWVWVTLRRRKMTLGGIDALFGVSSDPTFFSNFNMLRHAKFATLMAILMWMTPLTVILTAGTLVVTPVAQNKMIPCTVRSIVFPFDTKSSATLLKNTSFRRNMTVATSGGWTSEATLSIGAKTDRLLTWSIYSGSIVRPLPLSPFSNSTPSEITLPQVCGSNYCAYAVQFLGPALACGEPTWNRSGNHWTSADDFMGKTYYRAEPPAQGLLIAGASKTPKVNQRGNFSIVQCRPSIARYTVRQTIRNGLFDEPRIDVVEYILSTVPEPEYPSVEYVPNRVIFNRQVLNIRGNATSGEILETGVTRTTFYDEVEKSPSNIGPLLEKMSHQMVVSLLSFDFTGFDGLKVILDVTALEETSCSVIEERVIYYYYPLPFTIVYSISVAVTLGMAIAAFVALRRNGVASSSSISAIIRTTRNQTLDTMIGGSCLGGDPIPEELKKLQLQFGALRKTGASADQRIPPFALGIPAEIDRITTGGHYT